MTKTVAIKNFLEEGANGRKVETKELMEFKKSCTPAEWDKAAEDAAKALGVKLDEPKEALATAGI